MHAMNETMRLKILAILDGHRIISLATLRPDGWPQATTVGYVNEGLAIYFLCGRDSQKAHNLALDDRVSLTINDDPSDVMKIEGLSLAGRAEEMNDQVKAANLIARMPQRYPDSPPLPMPLPRPEQVRIYCVTPVVVSLLDYSKGFGHTDLVIV
jgi:nitroimidazol reductase NimA-like FMN-containing flavoprotein (pyridoxamine 5'-phosphate oxidase superfamily)